MNRTDVIHVAADAKGAPEVNYLPDGSPIERKMAPINRLFILRNLIYPCESQTVDLTVSKSEPYPGLWRLAYL